MPAYLPLLKKEWSPSLKTWLDDRRNGRNPDYFQPSGTQVYVGRQGSGKTVSAVHHVLKLRARYPRSILVTNLILNSWKKVPVRNVADVRRALSDPRFDPTRHYLFFSSAESMHAVLVHVNNDIYGVIYLIDEIQTYLNALDSKNVPMYVFTEISQQRKQRKVIIGTSQLFMRMAKPLREQCDNLIMCNTVAGVLTFQKAYDAMTLEQDYDGSLVGTVRKAGFFWHTREDRNAYDTFQKIISGADQYDMTSGTQTVRMVDKKGKDIRIRG